MNCKQARDRLSAARGESSAPLEHHLKSCEACQRYAVRLRAAGRLFREHHAEVEPDAAFASRVVSGLPSEATQVLGWAALRLLPVSLLLAIVLAWFAFQTAPAPQAAEVTAPTEDLLSWVVETSGDAP